MHRPLLTFLQQVVPGHYARKANTLIDKSYKAQLSFKVDVTEVTGNENEYIEKLENDIKSQLERKNRIEDKAKSLLFTITATITAITFSLNYFSLQTFQPYQIVSLCLIILSCLNLISGIVQSLKTLNIRTFHVIQTSISTSDDNTQFIIKATLSVTDRLKELIHSKQLNDLINIQLSNHTYASYNLIRNGIILFTLFFAFTVITTYDLKTDIGHDKTTVESTMNLRINDTVSVIVPYTFELQYEVNDVKLKQRKQ